MLIPWTKNGDGFLFVLIPILCFIMCCPVCHEQLFLDCLGFSRSRTRRWYARRGRARIAPAARQEAWSAPASAAPLRIGATGGPPESRYQIFHQPDPQDLEGGRYTLTTEIHTFRAQAIGRSAWVVDSESGLVSHVLYAANDGRLQVLDEDIW